MPEENDLQVRLLRLIDDLHLGGVDPNFDLEDVCSEAYKVQHPSDGEAKTDKANSEDQAAASMTIGSTLQYTDINAFIDNGIKPDATVLLIGTQSYVTRQQQPESITHREEAAMRPLFEKKSLTVLPLLFSGSFENSFPAMSKYKKEIGFEINKAFDYLRDLPKTVAHVHRLNENPDYKSAATAYEKTLMDTHAAMTAEAIEKQKVRLTQQFVEHQRAAHHRIDQSLLQFSPEQLLELDGKRFAEQERLGKQLLEQLKTLPLNQPDHALYRDLADKGQSQWDVVATFDGQYQRQQAQDASPVSLSDKLDELQQDPTVNTLVLTGAADSGKRNWLRQLERQQWQRWQDAQRAFQAAAEHPEQGNMLSALRTVQACPIPLYIDLSDPQRFSHPHEALIETALEQWGLDEAGLDWAKSGPQWLLLIDGFSRLPAETNYTVRNQLQQWPGRVIYTVDHDYLEHCQNPADYFMPANHLGDAQPKRLRWLVLNARERRPSITATGYLSSHSVPLRSSLRPETTQTTESAHTDRVTTPATNQPEANPGEKLTTREEQEERLAARLLLQRDYHADALNKLGQTLSGRAKVRGATASAEGYLKCAFISYAWPRGENPQRALQLRLKQLVADSVKVGIEVLLDIEQLAPGINVETFMTQGLKRADAVFLIGMPFLKERVELVYPDGNRTNAYFEFERIAEKHAAALKNEQPSPVLGLTHAGSNDASSYPETLQSWAIARIDLTRRENYYASLPDIWLNVLQLNEDVESLEAVKAYRADYQRNETILSDPEKIEAKRQQAKLDKAEQERVLQARYEELLKDLTKEDKEKLIAAEKDLIHESATRLRNTSEVFQKHSYIAQELATYVPLNGGAQPETKAQDQFDLHEQLFKKVSWKANAPASLVFINGPAGAGKSLFVAHLEQQQWHDFTEQQRPFPLRISLPRLSDPTRNIVKQALKLNDLDEALDEKLINTQTPFLLILDGFDELPLEKVDKTQNLYVSNQLHRYNAVVVLTCRSQYLPTLEKYLNTNLNRYLEKAPEGHSAPRDYNRFHIQAFDDQKIAQYLENYLKSAPRAWKTVEDYQSRLDGISGLKEMASTPFILKLICDTLPQLSATQHAQQKVTRTAVYRAFIEQGFVKEQWRRITQGRYSPKTSWTAAANQQCQAWAWERFVASQTSLPLPDGETEEQALLRKGCPVRTTTENQLSFNHKSLQEYFVAQYLQQSLNHSDHTTERAPFELTLHADHPALSILNARTLNGEPGIRAFLAESLTLYERSVLYAVIYASKNHPHYGIAAANALTTLTAAREAMIFRDFSGIHAPEVELAGAYLGGSSLAGANLQGAALNQTNLQDVNAEGADLTRIRLGELPTEYYDDRVKAIANHPTDPAIYAVAAGKNVILHTAAGRQMLEGHTKPVRALSWSPDGERLASTSFDKTVRLWRADGTFVATLEGHTRDVTALSWSPDGERLASSSEDKTVRLWRADGTKVATLEGHTDAVRALSWSPDGERLASASFDKTVRLWRADGTQVATLKGHRSYVTALSWSPDGERLASGSGDATVRLWRADGSLLDVFKTGAPVTALDWRPEPIAGGYLLSFSARSQVGQRVVTNNGSALVLITGAMQLLADGLRLAGVKGLDAMQHRLLVEQRGATETVTEAAVSNASATTVPTHFSLWSEAKRAEKLRKAQVECQSSVTTLSAPLQRFGQFAATRAMGENRINEVQAATLTA